MKSAKTPRSLGPHETVNFRQDLITGLDWLTARHPQEALGPHLGISFGKEVLPGIRMAISPRVEYNDEGWAGVTFISSRRLFTEEEVAQLRSLVESVVPVYETWNGVNTRSLGFVVGRVAALPLKDALARYRDGCPEHKSVFCGHQGCTWLNEGLARMLTPPGWH
jgi:hypothetical protein